MTWPDGRALPGNRWDLLDGRWPPTPPTVSVIVAHYRQPPQLARTLRALERQDHPRDKLEIIVADDGSPEEPLIPPGVRVVRQADEGFRLAAVRNLGVAHATGDVLVFLDADTTPEPSFIRRLSRLPALAPDAVTVGRRRHADLADLPVDADIESAVGRRELPEPRWLADAYRETADLLTADSRSYRFLIGAVLACTRPLFDIVGGFDESFTSYGGEDWEWAYRAWLAGAVFAHERHAVAWHDGPDAAGRPDEALRAKNAEALRLADLIPLPRSGGYGLRPAKIDIALHGPPPKATPAQVFVSVDSALAALPRAEYVEHFGAAPPGSRADRVRIDVELLLPLNAHAGELAAAVNRVEREDIGVLVLTDEHQRELVRITSSRARARETRWGRTDLFPSVRAVARETRTIPVDVDVEAYLGGWG